MTKQYVMTDYTGCGYITAGKVYEMLTEGIYEWVTDDEGDVIDIMGGRAMTRLAAISTGRVSGTT